MKKVCLCLYCNHQTFLWLLRSQTGQLSVPTSPELTTERVYREGDCNVWHRIWPLQEVNPSIWRQNTRLHRSDALIKSETEGRVIETIVAAISVVYRGRVKCTSYATDIKTPCLLDSKDWFRLLVKKGEFEYGAAQTGSRNILFADLPYTFSRVRAENIWHLDIFASADMNAV